MIHQCSIVYLCDACSRMFGMILEKLYVPDAQKVSGQVERKICAVGIIKLLTDCPAMLQTYANLWFVFLLRTVLS